MATVKLPKTLVAALALAFLGAAEVHADPQPLWRDSARGGLRGGFERRFGAGDSLTAAANAAHASGRSLRDCIADARSEMGSSENETRRGLRASGWVRVFRGPTEPLPGLRDLRLRLLETCPNGQHDAAGDEDPLDGQVGTGGVGGGDGGGQGGTAVPEPSTLLMAGLGVALVGYAAARRRRND